MKITGSKREWEPYDLLGLVILAVVLLLLLPIGTPPVKAHTMAVVSGQLTVDGTPVENALQGVDDTTALQYSMLAWTEKDLTLLGMNQNFPSPTSKLPTTSMEAFWDTYFAYCQHFGLTLARIGASDNWGTEVMYQTWATDRAAYFEILETMAEKAAAHGVFVVLVLAGTQDYPAFSFNGTGSPFDVGSQAYANYITYARDTMTVLANSKGIGIYDLWNEPDADRVADKFWQGNKDAFNAWSTRVAQDTQAYAFHPRTMGVAGQGVLFQWGQDDFNLSTGRVPFEIAQRHYYASDPTVVAAAEPEVWAQSVGKPLLWGELGENTDDVHTRWLAMEKRIDQNGGTAICTMTMVGTSGYPWFPTVLDWALYPLTLYLSDHVAPSLYPAVHPIDASISSNVGPSWPIALIVLGTYLIGFRLVRRGWWTALVPLGLLLILVAAPFLIARV